MRLMRSTVFSRVVRSTWCLYLMGCVAALDGAGGEPAARLEAQEPPARPSAAESAADFFKAHFFPYEPFYFLAGPEAPVAKFQLSFNYRIVAADPESTSALRRALSGAYFAYTQTSLWDLDKPSAPFFDTSYRPELLYGREHLLRASLPRWARLEAQAGVKHESNGRDGVHSRSLNIAYLSPCVQFGSPDGFNVKLAPRAWVYLPDLDDNPDLPEYRGHVDLRTVAGWERGPQLAALVRMGDGAQRGSLQLDLTLPFPRRFSRSLFFQAQYFTGYGESLLRYRERESHYRIGLALFR